MEYPSRITDEIRRLPIMQQHSVTWWNVGLGQGEKSGMTSYYYRTSGNKGPQGVGARPIFAIDRATAQAVCDRWTKTSLYGMTFSLVDDRPIEVRTSSLEKYPFKCEDYQLKRSDITLLRELAKPIDGLDGARKRTDDNLRSIFG